MEQKEFESLKVGDKVRIVSEKVGVHWNDKGEMDKWLGKVMTVRERYYNYALMKEDRGERTPNCGWCWWPNMIAEKVNAQEIHITVDGDKTIAVLKENGKVVNRAVAKCNVGDTFDFETGADIALKRVFGNDVKVSDDGKVLLYRKGGVKEVKRGAKVGEYIKIVAASDASKKYKNGDIFKVKEGTFFGGDIRVHYNGIGNTGGNGYLYINANEYVVLENYEPPKENPVFKPHIVSKNTGEHYGELGTKTNYKDAIGRELCVGDTVDLYNSRNQYRGEVAIAKDADKAFVMGCKGSSDDKNGTICDFKIIKKRSYTEIADGEIVDDIKYIKTEKGR